MSDVWERHLSAGDDEWDRPDSHGLQKGDTDGWGTPPQGKADDDAWNVPPQLKAEDDGWGTSPQGKAEDDGWGTPPKGKTKDDGWGTPPQGKIEDDGWNVPLQVTAEDDGWGTSRKDDNHENMDPHAAEFGDELPATQGDSGDFACRKCGETGHYARQCPLAEAQKCFNCDEPGHSKAECPNPTKSRACFNCGEEGHSKVECPKPRVFRGACRICSQEGHPASACPDKPADICKNCRQEGHIAMDCKENRKFDLNHIPDRLPEEAWAMMKKASDEKDLDDFREALDIYTKAVPDATYVDIEKRMRAEGFRFFLIALMKEHQDVITLIDLQGRLDREFSVAFFVSDKPQRPILESRWPEDAEDNLERLANAGLAYDRYVIKCRNCGELGHGSRACKQERIEFKKPEIKCYNCGAIGHRVRDCTEKRKSKYGCRNCGVEGHEARDCPEPRSAGDIECRRCNEIGHFAKDCPNQTERPPRTCRNCGSEDHIARECDQPRNPDTMVCRNCEKTGHAARDCPEPKNWSKVQCNRCGEMGHTVKRCPQPEDAEAGFVGAGTEEATWGQAGESHSDDVETVRQAVEETSFW